MNDNTTTQATFSFPDGVLLNGTSIDVQGNNLLERHKGETDLPAAVPSEAQA